MTDIYTDLNLKKSMSEKTVCIEEANSRFCFTAVGLPGDVVSGFLDLLEEYAKNCYVPEEVYSHQQNEI